MQATFLEVQLEDISMTKSDKKWVVDQIHTAFKGLTLTRRQSSLG
jgi:hypothetical protein